MEKDYIKTVSGRRNAGVLAHPTSFPSPYGIGDLGQSAYDFIDFLKESGIRLWQVLPLGPTGYGDSPYQSFSSYAGQPLIISPDLLKKDGLLAEEDLKDIPDWGEDKVDYGWVLIYKTELFGKAFKNFQKLLSENETEEKAYSDFVCKNADWLEKYALYMAIKDKNGGCSWLEWDDEEKDLLPSEMPQMALKYKERIDYYKFIQYEFFKQWSALREYAHENEIYIIGDIPIFVSMDSADAWAYKEIFQLDETGHPTDVSGVPPDYFSETGQLWGNPLYDWDYLKEHNYSWWIDRIKHQLTLVDFIRIDHFRGFEAYWAVPADEETAVNGEWIKGPGADLFNAIRASLGTDLPIFAEDLGVITDEVAALRDEFKFPGMRILQFGFDGVEDSTFLPHNFVENSLCYTGTHDNDTTLGWYNTLSEEAKKKLADYTGYEGDNPSWNLIRVCLASVSKYAIIPVWDLLSLGSEARINTPGKASGNWQWRYKKGDLSEDLSKKLKRYVEIFAR